MALENAVTTFVDGCSTWKVGDISQKWTGSSGVSLITQPIELGGDASETAMRNPIAVYKTTSTSQPAGMMIVRIVPRTSPGSVVTLFKFRSGSSVIAQLQVNAAMKLIVANSTGTVLAGPTAGAALAIGTAYVIEFGVLVGASPNGRIEVRVDGAQIADLTSSALGGSVGSISTFDAVHPNIDTIELTGGINMDVDYAILRSAPIIWAGSEWFASSTSSPALKKKTVSPLSGTAGDGDYRANTGWAIAGTPVGGVGTAHSDFVRDLPFDGSGAVDSGGWLLQTSASSTNNQNRDSVKTVQFPGDVGVVKCVAHTWSLRTTSAGATSVGFVVTSTGTWDNPRTDNDNASYTQLQQIMDYVPVAGSSQSLGGQDTTTPWTASELNRPIQLGIRLATIT